MPTISVSQLKYGEKLSENVQTKLGSILFYKGKVMSERDIEILKAFLVPTVSIELKNGAEKEEMVSDTKQAEEVKQNNPFVSEYEKMLILLKQVFNLANGSQTLPIFEIRTRLEVLIEHIEQYKVLTFVYKNWSLDDFIFHNSIMVSLTSYLLAKWHGFPQKDLMQIALAGILHDIGTIKVDPHILDKPAKVTSTELEEIKKHTVLGYNILKNVTALNEGVKLCTLQHHEREDGSGYPLGLKGEKIHIYAKIVAIADIFHAMTHHRHHKKANSPYLVLDQLQKESFGKVDPALVQTFINKVTQFHNGTLVKLNDNRIGDIVFSDPANPTRPWVNVNGQIINLTQERGLYIQTIVEYNSINRT